MGTITVNVNDDVENEFRRVAGLIYGTRKGSLGKALTEAMQEWTYEKRQKKIAEEALKLLEHGFKFGKRLYKNRCELYER